ncbi:MAG: hypothetical protein U0528_06640 [Anaerolineae bacterium]|nr:hypothetical protein [Anaerolineae bacterium]
MSNPSHHYRRDEVQSWLVALLAHPDLRERIPVEAGVSFPALYVHEGQLALTAFHYLVLRDNIGQPVKYATYSRVCLLAADLKLLSFATFDDEVLFKGMSLDAPYTEYILDSAQHSALKLSLAGRFAEIASRYMQQQPAGENGRIFLQQYPRLLPPSLMPYYRALNPAFCDWLQQA